MTASEQVSDAGLVARAQAGDEEAFRALIERYRDPLALRVRRRLSAAVLRKISVADVWQDACIVAARRLHEFVPEGRGAFGRWLGRIVELRIRKAIEHYAMAEKRATGREVTLDARRETCEFAGKSPTPSEAAIGAEFAEAAARALRRLPEDYRAVLRMLQQDDYTFEQASMRLGRTPGATRKLYSRALARYAEILKLERGTDG